MNVTFKGNVNMNVREKKIANAALRPKWKCKKKMQIQ